MNVIDYSVFVYEFVWRFFLNLKRIRKRSLLSHLEEHLNHPEKEHARWDARLIVSALN